MICGRTPSDQGSPRPKAGSSVSNSNQTPSPDRAGDFRVSAPRSHLAYACGGADMRGRMEIACKLVKLVTSHVNYNTHFSALSTPGSFGFSTKFPAFFYAIPQKPSFFQDTRPGKSPISRSDPRKSSLPGSPSTPQKAAGVPPSFRRPEAGPAGPAAFSFEIPVKLLRCCYAGVIQCP